MILYHFCKYLTRITGRFYYNKIVVSGLNNVPHNVPLLLAINHPNSFLDAVLVGAWLNRPTHFLARGDAFKNKTALPILKALNMLPVYRLSEGKENLNKNTETFDACHDILNERKVVLIFAEGMCENNWDLRPLKKGPARIAMKAWNSNTAASEVQVLPIGLTYEHYHGGGKCILINIGTPLTEKHFPEHNSEALFVKSFNQVLYDSLSTLAFVDQKMQEGDATHSAFRIKLRRLVDKNLTVPRILEGLRQPTTATGSTGINFVKATLLFWPLYALCNFITRRAIKSDTFYDSIAFGLFLFLWPVYGVAVVMIAVHFLGNA